MISIGHDDYRTVVGGVQRCIQQEQQSVNEAGAGYLNLYPIYPLPILAPESDINEVFLQVVCNGDSLGIASTTICLEALQNIRAQRIDLVVHALLGHVPGFIRLLGESAVNGKRIFWIHDYHSICPGYTLLRNTVQYCGIPPIESMACSICTYGEYRASQWSQIQALFDALDFTVLAPSEFAGSLWRDNSHLLYHELLVQPHTRFVESGDCVSVGVPAGKVPGNRVLRVAYTGHPMLHKGWPVFRNLANANRRNPLLEFHVLSDQQSHDLAGIHYTPVSVSVDQPAAMQEALVKLNIDLAFIWSVWPETYCLTAHEAAAAGVPVLTCEQSGNVARMVKSRDCGFVFRDEGELQDVFASDEIRHMLHALRARGHVRPMALEYSAMSLQLLGISG